MVPRFRDAAGGCRLRVKGTTMTVIVTLPDGATDKYMRFGDAYVKNGNGTLHVVRSGVKEPQRYAAGAWTDVAGDERHKKLGFWR